MIVPQPSTRVSTSSGLRYIKFSLSYLELFGHINGLEIDHLLLDGAFGWEALH